MLFLKGKEKFFYGDFCGQVLARERASVVVTDLQHSACQQTLSSLGPQVPLSRQVKKLNASNKSIKEGQFVKQKFGIVFSISGFMLK
jgi:hypothetical protein